MIGGSTTYVSNRLHSLWIANLAILLGTFGCQIAWAALMAPIESEVYLPPLDKCFSGQHQLL